MEILLLAYRKYYTNTNVVIDRVLLQLHRTSPFLNQAEQPNTRSGYRGHSRSRRRYLMDERRRGEETLDFGRVPGEYIELARSWVRIYAQQDTTI